MAGRRIKKAFSKGVRKSKRLAAKAKGLSKTAVRRSKRVLARQGVTGAQVDKALNKVKKTIKSEAKRQISKGRKKLKI